MHRHVPPFDISNESILHLGDRVKSDWIARLKNAAAEASAEEVMTAPKPGLVDPLTPGCHTDMDWRLFIISCAAIAPFWEDQARTGIEGTEPCRAMEKLRCVGLKAEKAMFDATKGINTHKGLIYIMSLLLYGAGRTIFLGEPMTSQKILFHASEPVMESAPAEFASIEGKKTEDLTNGEKLYLKYGVTGVRGDAYRGFPSISSGGLPELIKNLYAGVSKNDASISALLAIMELNEDSNVIHRGGYEYWKSEYRRIVRETRKKYIPASGERSAVTELEGKFKALRISPGGAADLLCCTLFVYKITLTTCQQ